MFSHYTVNYIKSCGDLQTATANLSTSCAALETSACKTDSEINKMKHNVYALTATGEWSFVFKPHQLVSLLKCKYFFLQTVIQKFSYNK